MHSHLRYILQVFHVICVSQFLPRGRKPEPVEKEHSTKIAYSKQKLKFRANLVTLSPFSCNMSRIYSASFCFTVHPRKTNMDTQNYGLEKVTPALNIAHFWCVTYHIWGQPFFCYIFSPKEYYRAGPFFPFGFST